MAPKKKITEIRTKVFKKSALKPLKSLKAFPKIVKVNIGSSVALAQLIAKSSHISPKKDKTPTDTNTPANNKKPVKKCTPVTRKCADKTPKQYSLDNSETPQEQKIERPGPKSKKTLGEIKKKPANSDRKVKNKPGKKKQQKSVKSAITGPEIGLHNSSDILSKEESASSKDYENVAATPIKRPRGRPKGSFKRKPKNTLAKSKNGHKILNAIEIKDETSMLKNALDNTSPKNRPNSITSNKSCLTWTKDISPESNVLSDSPTTVTVVSNDSISSKNNQQVENPDQLKVENDNLKQINTNPSKISRNKSSSSESESSSSTSSSSSSDSELSDTNNNPEVNLSTTSFTPKSPLSDTNTDPCSQRIGNLKKSLNDFKADISKLCSCHDLCNDSDFRGVDPDIDDIINKCDNFERTLEDMFQQTNIPEKSIERHRTVVFTEQNESDNRSLEDYRRSSYEDNRSETSSPERYTLRQKSVHNDATAKLAKPCLFRGVSAANSRDTSIPFSNKQLVSNVNSIGVSPTDSFKTFTSDSYNYVPFDRTHDDEDALSLYAESISGMESSRIDSVASISNVSLHDVYVPKYSPCMREKYVYRPTKIRAYRSNLAEELEDGEIPNADYKAPEPCKNPKEISRACVSSSGSRDMNQTALELLEDSNRISSIAEESIKRGQTSSQPRRLFSSYTKMNPVRSCLYRGICFFNVASQCKKSNCRFTHVIIDPTTFKTRLSCLSEDKLISEYLLMCAYVPLRRKLCILFVEECKRRQATRILFEMTIDLGLGVIEIDEDLKVKVLETALLHLNSISLDACDDLLKFKHKDTMLCDALLSCMANSQNFAQFKRAFVKLATLMCELNRPVDIEVASSILERVCILPGEDTLARGMLTLMKNTDVSIFENSLAKSFEVQLLIIDSDVHGMYLLAKNAALGGRLTHSDEMYPAASLLMPHVSQNGPRQTSPDSTNVDNLPEPLPPRRFAEPRLPLWRRRDMYNHRKPRGRVPTRMSGRVYKTQAKVRNGPL